MRFSRWMIGAGALFAAAWSGGWMYVRSQAEPQLNQQISALRAQGTDISYGGLSIGGFPFGYDGRIAEPELNTRARLTHPRLLTSEVATISAAAPFLNARASVLEGRRARFDLPPEAQIAIAFADETWTLDLLSDNGSALGELDGDRARAQHDSDRLEVVIRAGETEAGRLEAANLNVSVEADSQMGGAQGNRRPSATFSADQVTLSGTHRAIFGDLGGRAVLAAASGAVDLRDDCSASLKTTAVETAFAAVMNAAARAVELTAQNAELDAVGACANGALRLDSPGRFTLKADAAEARLIQDPRYVSVAADSAHIEAAIDADRMRADVSLSGVGFGDMPFDVAQVVFGAALQGAAPAALTPPRPLTAQTVTASLAGPMRGAAGTAVVEAIIDGGSIELSALSLPVPISGSLPIDRAQLSAEADINPDAVSALRLTTVEADILGAEIRADGAFTFTPDGRPVGDMILRIANMSDALRAAQQRRLINPMQMMMVQFSLAAAAPLDAETGLPTVRVRADGDKIFLNGAAIMDAPALRAPRG